MVERSRGVMGMIGALLLASFAMAASAQGAGEQEATPDAAQAPGGVDVRERMQGFRELIDAERYDEALDEAVWLWDNMLDHRPSMVGVRVSFLVSDMRRLARRSDTAFARFDKMRDELQAELVRGEIRRDRLRDWLALNEVIEDDAAVLAWVDRNIDDEAGRSSLARYAHAIDDVLQRHGRHADLALIVDEVAEVEKSLGMILMYDLPMPGVNLDAQTRATRREIMIDFARRDVTENLEIALRGLDPVAVDGVVDVVLRMRNTEAMRRAILQGAVNAGRTTPRLVEIAKEHDDRTIARIVERLPPMEF